MFCKVKFICGRMSELMMQKLTANFNCKISQKKNRQSNRHHIGRNPKKKKNTINSFRTLEDQIINFFLSAVNRG